MKRTKLFDPLPSDSRLCYADVRDYPILNMGLNRVESELLRHPHPNIRRGWRAAERDREDFRRCDAMMGDPYP